MCFLLPNPRNYNLSNLFDVRGEFWGRLEVDVVAEAADVARVEVAEVDSQRVVVGEHRLQ